MKTNKFILAGLMAVGCFFAACTEETPAYVPAQPETNEVQAYIYNTTPTYVQLTELGGKFPVVIGRNTTNAVSFEVTHDDNSGLFTLDTEVSFAEGQIADTLWIQANYNYGETNTIVAYQFDTLLNFFLENTVDDKGEITFTNTLLPTREEYIKKEA